MPKKIMRLSGTAIQAQQELREYIASPPMLFVVLGDNEEAKELAGLANDYAGTDMDPRLVVWAPSVSHITMVVENTLTGLKPVLDDQNHDRGFTVSLSNKIMDIIDKNEPAPDDVRVVQAWTNAMKS